MADHLVPGPRSDPALAAAHVEPHRVHLPRSGVPLDLGGDDVAAQPGLGSGPDAFTERQWEILRKAFPKPGWEPAHAHSALFGTVSTAGTVGLIFLIVAAVSMAVVGDQGATDRQPLGGCRAHGIRRAGDHRAGVGRQFGRRQFPAADMRGGSARGFALGFLDRKDRGRPDTLGAGGTRAGRG